MSKHETTWEDDQMVGLRCDGIVLDQILSLDHDQPEACGRCGAQVRLVWRVYIEEVAAAPAPTPGKKPNA